MRSSVKKAVIAALAVSAVAVGGMGALHMPFARPALALLKGTCPMGNANGADVEQTRLETVRQVRGATLSKARPALGFVLDATTNDAALVWAEEHKLSCKEERQRTLTKCSNVPAELLGEPEGGTADLNLGFNTSGILVNLTAVRRDLAPEIAEKMLAGVVGRMATDLGTPTVASGERTGAFLSGADLRTATVEYRFSDYMAEVSATNIPQSGIQVREHYISARD